MDFSKMSLRAIRSLLEKEGSALDEAKRDAFVRDCRVGVQKLYKQLCRREALSAKERLRMEAMQLYEKDARLQGYSLIAGVDEAGRGPLAGPVVAAAVIMPERIDFEGINDSKKLTPQKRQLLFDQIKKSALCWSCGTATVEEIDAINILRASLLAMQRALFALAKKPEFILVDAVKIPGINTPQLSIVKGDGLSVSIAAASITAKVTRDKMMDDIDRDFPQYGFAKHKGYGTLEHLEALRIYGTCPVHRRSFTYNLDHTVSS